MQTLKLTAALASSALLLPLLAGCTAELTGQMPGGGATTSGVTAGQPGAGGSGSNLPGIGGTSTTTPGSSKPAVDVTPLHEELDAARPDHVAHR